MYEKRATLAALFVATMVYAYMPTINCSDPLICQFSDRTSEFFDRGLARDNDIEVTDQLVERVERDGTLKIIERLRKQQIVEEQIVYDPSCACRVLAIRVPLRTSCILAYCRPTEALVFEFDIFPRKTKMPPLRRVAVTI